MVLEMLFLTLSKVDIWFAEQELVWGIYMAAKALSTTNRMKIIDKKKFAAVALNIDDETFVINVRGSRGANDNADLPLLLGPSSHANE